MNKRLLKPNISQGSLIKNIEEVTQSSYALVPRDYYSINKSLKETEQYRNEIEVQLKHHDSYLRLRKFLKEKFFNKKIKSVDELFDLQLGVIQNINYGLQVVNNEARQRLYLLENYIEKINDDYEYNFLGIDGKKDSLNPLLHEFMTLYQKSVSLTRKDEEYFDVERKLRKLKRELSESGLSYKKMLDVVEDFGKERKSLSVFEDFFRHTIHLSERMVDKSSRFEYHIANTKDAYIMAKRINCGFAAVLKAIKASSSTISQLQNVLAEGLTGMGGAVSDVNLIPYKEFEIALKSRYDAVKSLTNRSDRDKERMIGLEKRLLS